MRGIRTYTFARTAVEPVVAIGKAASGPAPDGSFYGEHRVQKVFAEAVKVAKFSVLADPDAVVDDAAELLDEVAVDLRCDGAYGFGGKHGDGGFCLVLRFEKRTARRAAAEARNARRVVATVLRKVWGCAEGRKRVLSVERTTRNPLPSKGQKRDGSAKVSGARYLGSREKGTPSSRLPINSRIVKDRSTEELCTEAPYPGSRTWGTHSG